MRSRLIPEHTIPRYHAFSAPEEEAAYIDATASSPAIPSFAPDSPSTTIPPSPTLSEISLVAQVSHTFSPTQSNTRISNEHDSRHEIRTLAEDFHKRLCRLNAMLTLYNLARMYPGIEQEDWEEYILPYEEGDLEMLEQICPKEQWDEEIRGEWPNLIAFARWKERRPNDSCAAIPFRY